MYPEQEHDVLLLQNQMVDVSEKEMDELGSLLCQEPNRFGRAFLQHLKIVNFSISKQILTMKFLYWSFKKTILVIRNYDKGKDF